MQTMRDMLEYYNNLDVLPFLEAAEKLAAFWRNIYQLDMFDCISVPGLAERALMKTRSKFSYFMLPQKPRAVPKPAAEATAVQSEVPAPPVLPNPMFVKSELYDTEANDRMLDLLTQMAQPGPSTAPDVTAPIPDDLELVRQLVAPPEQVEENLEVKVKPPPPAPPPLPPPPPKPPLIMSLEVICLQTNKILARAVCQHKFHAWSTILF
jgi:hypothetical protein